MHYRRILLFGTFDTLHPGHEFLLNEAKKKGAVTVVVARDANVERFKGHRPVQSETERIIALKERFPGIEILLGSENDFLESVKIVKPDLILLGYDQALPPGISLEDFPCPYERLPAFKPEEFKSSIWRNRHNK